MKSNPTCSRQSIRAGLALPTATLWDGRDGALRGHRGRRLALTSATEESACPTGVGLRPAPSCVCFCGLSTGSHFGIIVYTPWALLSGQCNCFSFSGPPGQSWGLPVTLQPEGALRKSLDVFWADEGQGLGSHARRLDTARGGGASGRRHEHGFFRVPRVCVLGVHAGLGADAPSVA